MAKRRMFSKEITESDAFREMPLSSQALYFHLGLSADDDGVVNNPKTVQRCIGASSDDLKILLAKRFVIAIEDSGLIVIKHWRINNYIQKDRYTPSKYQKELRLLGLDENNAYSDVDTICIQNGYSDKERIEKNSEDKNSLVQSSVALDKDNDSNKVNNDAAYLFLLLINNRYVEFKEKERYVSYFKELLLKDMTVKDIENLIDRFFEELDEDDIEEDRYSYFTKAIYNLIEPDDDDLPF